MLTGTSVPIGCAFERGRYGTCGFDMSAAAGTTGAGACLGFGSGLESVAGAVSALLSVSNSDGCACWITEGRR